MVINAGQGKTLCKYFTFKPLSQARPLFVKMAGDESWAFKNLFICKAT
jgi:hypothetical protein